VTVETEVHQENTQLVKQQQQQGGQRKPAEEGYGGKAAHSGRRL
jgi:hypothetical protein